MIQIWSCASTETPMVFPMIQWFGKGFGHMGSTSNRGAWTPAASTTARFSSTANPMPSATITVRKDSPRYKFRFMLFGPPDRIARYYTRFLRQTSASRTQPPAHTLLLVNLGVARWHIRAACHVCVTKQLLQQKGNPDSSAVSHRLLFPTGIGARFSSFRILFSMPTIVVLNRAVACHWPQLCVCCLGPVAGNL